MSIKGAQPESTARRDAGARQELRTSCVDAALAILEEPEGPEVDIREVASNVGKKGR